MPGIHRVLRGRARGLHAAFLVAVAALMLVAAPSALAARGTGALRICSSCAAAGGDLSRYDYVILHAWEHARIPALKAANPNLKAIVYKDMAATVQYASHDGVDDELLPAGVGYYDAHRNHPDWFLLDTQGRRVESAHFSGVWLMDVGSRAYQDRWLANVASELRGKGWDGVMLDDTNYSPAWHLAGRTLAKYPGDAQYAAATRSFLARVGPPLMADGFLVLPNVYTVWPSGHDVWRDWIQFTSGAVQEYWTKWGEDASQHFTGADWSYRREFLRITQQAGKVYLGITYAPLDDVRSMRYARASFLLDWNGGRSALVFEPSPGGQDPYSQEWTADVGMPLGRAYQAGRVWRRDFETGVVLVNPSTSTASIALGGTFYTPNGTAVTSVSLRPASGLVLRSTPPPPDTTPPETAFAARPLTPTSSANASFRAVASEPGASFRCRLDAGAVRRCRAATLLTGLSPGSHTLQISAVDRAGNVDATPVEHTWTVQPLTSRIRLSSYRRGRARIVRVVFGKVRVPAELRAAVAAASLERRRSVTLYRKTYRGWRAVARLRTGPRGGFERRLRFRRGVRFARVLAVARYGDATVASGVIRVRRPRS
ncbi:MAG TPA: putative glycoside hydrolase [Gaiellaceae bacterium]|nr:putative glycoside hydrolase [Gaiellaceae bacterium]